MGVNSGRIKLLTDAVASAGEDDSAAASIAADAPASVDGAESEDGTSPAASAAGPVPAVDADVAVIQQRLGAIEDPIVRAAVAGALTRIEERLSC